MAARRGRCGRTLQPMRRFLIVPLATAALAVAGCGSGDDADTTAAPAASTAAKTTPAPAADGSPVAIGMQGLAFSPKDVTVKTGTKITWTNLEDIPHNVVAEEGADFESETFGKGKTFSYTPKKAGTIKYVCTIHPGMEGTITVEG